MKNLAPMKNCPGWGGGVQGNLNWMPGYMLSVPNLELSYLGNLSTRSDLIYTSLLGYRNQLKQ